MPLRLPHRYGGPIHRAWIILLILFLSPAVSAWAISTQYISFSAPTELQYTANAITLTATASSGLPVQLTVVSGPASITGNQLYLTAPGIIKVRASQIGNATYLAASSIEKSITITSAPVTITLSDLTSTFDGTAKPITATTAPNAVPVSITYDGGLTPPTDAGIYSVTAEAVPPNYTGSASGTLTIEQATAVLTFNPPGSLDVRDHPHVLTATSTSNAPINFTVVSGPGILSDTGTSPTQAGVFNEYLTITGAGTVVIRASQIANANFAAATSLEKTVTTTANPLDPTWYPPEFTTQPTDQSRSDGSSAHFSVYADACPNATYQWQSRANPNEPWIDVTAGPDNYDDGRSNYYGFTARLANSGRQYRCVATNAAGVSYSTFATLTVQPAPPSFWYSTQHPQNQYVPAGAKATFTVSPVGSIPMQYQWRLNGQPIDGANQPTLEINNGTDGSRYDVIVSNAGGSVTSGAAQLYIISSPIVQSEPQNLSIPELGQGSVSFTYTSVGPTTIRWFHNDAPLNVANPYISFSGAAPNDAGDYYATITNNAGTTTTNHATVTIVPTPAPNPYVDDRSMGGSYILSAFDAVSNADRNSFTYQWYRNGEAIAGATSSTLTLSTDEVARLGEYFATATNAAGTAVGQTTRVDGGIETYPATYHWLSTSLVGSVIHFLYADTPRIERYDLSTGSWLSPINLSATPVGFVFSPDACFVAFTNRVDRYTLDFGSSQQLYTTTNQMRNIGLVGDYLITVEAFGSTAVYHSLVPSTGVAVAQSSIWDGPNKCLTFSNNSSSLIGRTDYSADLKFITIGTDGTFGSLQKPLNLDSSIGRTFTWGDGTHLGDEAGGIYRTSDFTQAGQTGGITPDAIVASDGVLYVLRIGWIARLNSSFFEEARYPLTARGSRLLAHGDNLYVVRQSASSGEHPAITQVRLTDFNATQTVKEAINPNGLAIWSPQIQSNGDNGVIIYSKLHQNVFRWSAETWDYLPSRGLPNSPNRLAASDTENSVYFETSDYTLNGLNLADGQIRSVGSLPARIDGLLITGNTAIVKTKVKSIYGTSVLIDGDDLHTGAMGNHGPRPLAWAALDKRAYYFRSSSPTDLVYRSLTDNGKIESTEVDTPYHDDSLLSGPISVSPDSKYILVGTGNIFEHHTLTITATIPGDIISAAWSAGQLQVLRAGANGSVVTSYNPANWTAQAMMSYPGVPQALLSLRGDRTLLVTSESGILNYRMLDSVNLTAIDPLNATAQPTILQQPENLTGTIGQSLLLSVATRGGTLPHYQWQIRMSGSSAWTDLHDDGNILGSNTGQLVVASQPITWSSARFRVVVTNAAGTVISTTSEVGLSGNGAVTAITAAGGYAAFTRSDGTIWTLGNGANQALGDGLTTGRYEPFLLATSGRAVAETYNLMLIHTDGSASATGSLSSASGGVLAKLPGVTHAIMIGDHGRAILNDDGTAHLPLGSSSNKEMHSEPDVQALYCGSGTYLMIKADGSLWGLGDNSFGQLGDGSFSYQEAPVMIASHVKFAVAGSFTLYLTDTGELWGLGYNASGQLGDSSTTNRTDPVLMDTNVKTVAASANHTLYIKNDGSVWCTGYNLSGQLGDGSTINRTSPVHVADGGYAVAAGTYFSYLLKTDGSLWAAGSNTYGVIGQPVPGNYSTWQYVTSGLPMAPPPPANLIASVNVDASGIRLNWPPSADATYEVWRSSTSSLNDAARIASGLTQNIYFDATAVVGQEYMYWTRYISLAGTSGFSPFASGTRADDYVPRFTLQPISTVVRLGTFGPILRVEAQGGPQPALRWQVKTSDEADWADIFDNGFYTGSYTAELAVSNCPWYFNHYKFRCVATNPHGTAISDTAVLTITAADLAPAIFRDLPDQTVNEGRNFTLSVLLNYPTTATLTHSWTKNGEPIQGANSASISVPRATFSDAGTYAYTASASTGTVTSRTATVTVLPAAAVNAVSAGEDFTIFLQDTGTPWAMGNNYNKRTGLSSGTTQYLTSPYTYSSGAQSLIAVAAGPSHSLWVDAYGYVYSSGVNSYGQALNNFGLSSGTNFDAVAVAAGNEHSVILKRDGTVWAVGANESGQLGDGTTTNRNTPVQVMSGVRAIAAGSSHTFFIKDDDTLWAVGSNIYGQLGDGTRTNRSTPVQIATNVSTVSTGAQHTLFVSRDGTLWGAGTNYYGMLSDRVIEFAQVLIPIPLATDVISCAAGNRHSAFIKSDGSLMVMGDNSGGQLGLDLATTQLATPRLLASNVAAVALGAQHTVFLTNGGELWVCGRNVSGQLGINTPSGYAITPVRLWSAARTTPISAVTELTASQGTETTGVRLSWRAVTGSTDYTILRSTTPDLIDATPIATQHGMPMFFDTTAARDTLYYYWVNNGLTSDRAQGYVSLPTGLPTITRNLSKQVNCYTGTSYTFSITATGPAPLSYQYRKNGAPIPGATSASYTLKINSSADAGVYDVLVTNNVGSVSSTPSLLVLDSRYQGISFYLPDAMPFSGSPISLNATSTFGLPVAFTVDSGPALIDGNQLTLTGVGTVTITATQPGNELIEAANPVSRTFSVITATLSPQLSGLVQAYNGQPRNIVVSGLPSGTSPSITYDGLNIAPTEIGTYHVQVVVDTTTQRGVVSGTLAIVPASQTITFSPITDQPFTTEAIPLIATSSSGLPVQFQLISGPGLLNGVSLELSNSGQIIVRANQPGDLHYDAAPSVDRSFVIFPTLAIWMADNFTSLELSDESISGTYADPDGDGLTNLLEYALGLDPKSTDTSGLPEVGTSSTDWTYTYNRPAERPDLTYEVEYSIDLATWSTAGVTLTKTADNGSTQTWQATLPTSASTNVFFRLKITQN